jgi:hypothetical protein
MHAALNYHYQIFSEVGTTSRLPNKNPFLVPHLVDYHKAETQLLCCGGRALVHFLPFHYSAIHCVIEWSQNDNLTQLKDTRKFKNNAAKEMNYYMFY